MSIAASTYRRATRSMLVASVLFAVLAAVIMFLVGDRPRPASANWKSVDEYLGWSLGMMTGSILGALVAARQPRNTTGWVFSVGGFIGMLALLGDQWGVYALVASPGKPGGVIGMFLSYPGLYVSWGMLAVFLPLLFPDGHLPSRRWRPVAWLGAASVIMWASEILRPDFFGPGNKDFPGVANPIGIPGSDSVLQLVNEIAIYGLFAAMLLAVSSLVFRYRRSRDEERQQLKVIAYTVVVVVAVQFFVANIDGTVRGTPFQLVNSGLGTLATIAIPLSFGVAILRYRLYEIDVIIRKTFVYGAMAGFITAVYVAVVVGIGSAIGAGDKPNLALSIMATAVVAVAFQPVRERVQRLANRLVYGERATPYEVMSGFSRRVAEVVSLDEVLPRMAEAGASGVGARASRVQVFLQGGEAREAVWPAGAVVTGFDWEMPVIHQGDVVGSLAIAKPPAEPIRPNEERLLTDLVSQAGIALRNVQLAAELQGRLEQISEQADQLRESRHRLVRAQDGERKRIERDLHDGAQQRLVALGLALRMAMNRLSSETSEELGALLQGAADELKHAHTELRDLARGIHPAVLTDAGLQAAVESLATRAPVPVRLTVPAQRYPASLEGAAYFVVSEALANVAKYAGANAASVVIEQRDGKLRIEVEDDGKGGAAPSPGSGLSGLADRVAAVNGVLQLDSPPGGGTKLVVELPCE